MRESLPSERESFHGINSRPMRSCTDSFPPIATYLDLGETLIRLQGMLDEIFPIDDYILCLQHGAPKLARYDFRPPFLT